MPTSLLEPPPLEDPLTWRPATAADAGAIAALIDTCFEADGGYRIAESEVRTELEIPDGDPEHDTLVGVLADGQIVALGWVIVPAGAATTFRVFDWNFVRPDFRDRGIGSFLLHWWERRGRQLATSSPLPGLLRQHPYDWQDDRIRLLEANGYRPERYFTELIRDLAEPIPLPSVPSDVVIAPWRPELLEPARLVSNAAFADHWGSEPIASERWEAWQDEFFAPEASAVAYVGEEPAGLIMCAVYPHDFDDRGRTEGWIERLATLVEHRGRGLATALVNRAMLAFRERGLEFALLSADTDNPTGAMSLYEGLGFRPEKRSVAYVKSISD